MCYCCGCTARVLSGAACACAGCLFWTATAALPFEELPARGTLQCCEPVHPLSVPVQHEIHTTIAPEFTHNAGPEATHGGGGGGGGGCKCIACTWSQHCVTSLRSQNTSLKGLGPVIIAQKDMPVPHDSGYQSDSVSSGIEEAQL